MPETHVLKLLAEHHEPMFLGHCGMTSHRQSALEYKSMEQASDVADEFNEDESYTSRGIMAYPALAG